MTASTLDTQASAARGASGSRGRVLMLIENESVPADRRVWDESLALKRAGFEVAVICPQGADRDRALIERRDGIDIHRFPLPFAVGGPAGYAREYASALWHTWRIARRLARTRPFDVVHASNPPDLLLLAVLGLRRQGARLVFDHHDLVPELCLVRFGHAGRILHRLTLAAERLSFRLADAVIATNESYRRIALTRGRKRPEDVFVVRNGPDLARFRPREPDPSLKCGRAHLIGYLGVMGVQDGIDHALRALALVARRRADWRAVFVGDGPVLPQMRELARELGLGDAVKFVGWQDDEGILRVLSTADVCLAPDPRSPLNDVSTMTKIAEYMAMARPVVSYDLTESRISAGDAAVYAESDDVEGFAALIDDLLDDPERRSAMGAIGRERVERLLCWEHSERALTAAYARVLGEPSVAARNGRPEAGSAVGAYAQQS